jgi:hypothetical protein
VGGNGVGGEEERECYGVLECEVLFQMSVVGFEASWVLDRYILSGLGMGD